MSIQKDYERSMRRLKESVYRKEKLGYVAPRCVDVVLSKVRPPEQVASRKYLVMLMLFSQTCEQLGATLTMREQLVVKMAILSRKHPTPDIQRKIRRLDELVISQDKNIEGQLLLLEYRAQILIDILDGKEPNSRYT
ncbi:hypothetical protein pEaSNUABM28_00236 [Erwinia phage pEa_SNUABM_28]|uniref:Uncharacterized protein n=2 Tax=Alexandravirus TaxID=2733088 RepID=A0AAE8XQU4_9CAUD|nr:hypothetical protein MPK63_gp233 [Erwinia phage pEa_SNUABM_22]YP_010299995.1 hypothetical protein MPK64_gp234 [Erwinia phage pEa_SNUABM_16]QZE58793.1 hypothetical protein pEaSNUABM28_00236 [Erwinia phage pEa_SNUABM_28]QZE59137.1 hypothetical protein pEaSNUABM18_00234 [Erwinia phage pEa_SNUABM_18]UAW96378.1 hypothetical protein pEaSNUABM16_00234 [Erwinia phage pEa_SNUABM_16]UAW96721.1 hypothetical protein pEaSNUABM22_00234 [Erwinia phage pEa_SNUABM_22]